MSQEQELARNLAAVFGSTPLWLAIPPAVQHSYLEKAHTLTMMGWHK